MNQMHTGCGDYRSDMMYESSAKEGMEFYYTNPHQDTRSAAPPNTTSLHEFFNHFQTEKTDNAERIRTILNSCPDAAFAKNEEGELPLHVACKRFYPNEIVMPLLKANPRAIMTPDANGTLPLSIACGSHGNRNLIVAICELYPAAASVKNKYGEAPIHLLCDTDPEDPPPKNCVISLVKAAPIMVAEPDSEGNFLVQKACDCVLVAAEMALCEESKFSHWPECMPELSCSLSNLACFLKASPTSAVFAMKYICSEIEERYRSEYSHLVTAIALQLIIQAGTSLFASDEFAYGQVRVSPDRRKLMQAVLSGELPISFKAFEVLFGDQWSRVRQIVNIPDSQKLLPLHLAAKAGINMDPRIIERLVCLNPEAASRYDNAGKLPLHYAVESNLPHEGVKAIFDAYPEAFSLYRETGEHEGLGPALVAASHDASLDVILFLLLKNPIVSSEECYETRPMKKSKLSI